MLQGPRPKAPTEGRTECFQHLWLGISDVSCFQACKDRRRVCGHPTCSTSCFCMSSYCPARPCRRSAASLRPRFVNLVPSLRVSSVWYLACNFLRTCREWSIVSNAADGRVASAHCTYQAARRCLLHHHLHTCSRESTIELQTYNVRNGQGACADGTSRCSQRHLATGLKLLMHLQEGGRSLSCRPFTRRTGQGACAHGNWEHHSCSCLVFGLQHLLQLCQISRGQQHNSCCVAAAWLQRPRLLYVAVGSGLLPMSTWPPKLHAAPQAVGLPCAIGSENKPPLCMTAHAVEHSSCLQLLAGPAELRKLQAKSQVILHA